MKKMFVIALLVIGMAGVSSMEAGRYSEERSEKRSERGSCRTCHQPRKHCGCRSHERNSCRRGDCHHGCSSCHRHHHEAGHEEAAE